MPSNREGKKTNKEIILFTWTRHKLQRALLDHLEAERKERHIYIIKQKTKKLDFHLLLVSRTLKTLNTRCLHLSQFTSKTRTVVLHLIADKTKIGNITKFASIFSKCRRNFKQSNPDRLASLSAKHKNKGRTAFLLPFPFLEQSTRVYQAKRSGA